VDGSGTAFTLTLLRAAARVLFLSLACWFVIASPKTPQQFYDAANRQQEREKGRLVVAFMRLDPVRGADAAKLLQLNTLADAMRRMELDSDCRQNRRHVDINRPGVLLGAYQSTAESPGLLTLNSPEYRSLLSQFDQLRAEIRTDKKYSQAFRDLQKQLNATDSRRRNIIRFVDMMQGVFWRNFQAMIFWPKSRGKNRT
jgi:hypothetical protein